MCSYNLQNFVKVIANLPGHILSSPDGLEPAVPQMRFQSVPVSNNLLTVDHMLIPIWTPPLGSSTRSDMTDFKALVLRYY